VEAGQRQRSVYLPHGPQAWYDFWTGKCQPAGRVATVAAPLSVVPLFVPAGTMIPLTDTTDFTRLHDEPSRQIRVFAPPATGEHTFTLYEDDGLSLRYREGEFAEIEFSLRSTRSAIALTARKSGNYALPGTPIRIVLPPGERRRLTLHGEGVELAGPADAT
jgi:alpha-glucosidase